MKREIQFEIIELFHNKITFWMVQIKIILRDFFFQLLTLFFHLNFFAPFKNSNIITWVSVFNSMIK